jgi:hypothetical protein
VSESTLARIGRELVEAERPLGERAYERLRCVVQEGTEIDLTNHQLVLAVSQALWNHELATVHLGLSELETRTALDAVDHGRRAA